MTGDGFQPTTTEHRAAVARAFEQAYGHSYTSLVAYRRGVEAALEQFAKDGDVDFLIRTLQELK